METKLAPQVTKIEKLEARHMKAEDRLNAHFGRCRKCEEDRDCITVHGFTDAVARAQAALDKITCGNCGARMLDKAGVCGYCKGGDDGACGS